MRFEPSFSGWIGKLADDVTFQSIQDLTLRIVPFYKNRAVSGQKLIVGYDSRFMSKVFAEYFAGIVSNFGIKVFFSTQVVPSPVLAINSIHKKCLGFVNFTSDMLSSEYIGLRAFTMDGDLIVENDLVFPSSKLKSNSLEQKNFQHWVKRGHIEKFDPSICYENFIDENIDVNAISPSVEKIFFNPCYGSTRLYFETVCNKRKNVGNYSMNYAPLSEIHSFNANPKIHTNELIEAMLSKNCQLGFSLSPDGTNFQFLNEFETLETVNVLNYLVQHFHLHKHSILNKLRQNDSDVLPPILISNSLSLNVETILDLGFVVEKVADEEFHQCIKTKKYLLAIDQYEQFYTYHHGVPDGLFIGYLLFEYFNVIKSNLQDKSLEEKRKLFFND